MNWKYLIGKTGHISVADSAAFSVTGISWNNDSLCFVRNDSLSTNAQFKFNPIYKPNSNPITLIHYKKEWIVFGLVLGVGLGLKLYLYIHNSLLGIITVILISIIYSQQLDIGRFFIIPIYFTFIDKKIQ